ncbi:hypothetical protein VPH35_108801 [Triticum aestivum]
MSLIDDSVLIEILLHLPSNDPEHLFGATLVCKPWLRIVCHPAFRRQYRAFHGAPPLLGLLYQNQDYDRSPILVGHHRHGRVLLHMFHKWAVELLVWDPVTGDRHVVPEPDIDWMVYTAAVLYVAASCNHLDCHGGPFRVVFMATEKKRT